MRKAKMATRKDDRPSAGRAIGSMYDCTHKRGKRRPKQLSKRARKRQSGVHIVF